MTRPPEEIEVARRNLLAQLTAAIGDYVPEVVLDLQTVRTLVEVLEALRPASPASQCSNCDSPDFTCAGCGVRLDPYS